MDAPVLISQMNRFVRNPCSFRDLFANSYERNKKNRVSNIFVERAKWLIVVVFLGWAHHSRCKKRLY